MHIRKESLWFVLFFVLLSCFSFSILEYSREQKSLFELSNSLYSPQSLTIESADWISLDKAMESAGKDVRLFIECNENFRFFVQSDQWRPVMQEGDFFSPGQTGDRAVIGKEMKDLVEQRGQKQYVDFENKLYEVIGIMGASFSTSADYLVLLQPNSVSDIKAVAFVLDGDTEKMVRQGAARLRADTSQVSASKRDTAGIARISDTIFFSRLLRLCAVFLLFFGFMAFFRLWYEKQRSELRLLVLLGISGMKIIVTQVTNVFLQMAAALFICDALIAVSEGGMPEVEFIVLVNGGFLFAAVLFTLFHIKKELRFG